MTCNIRVWFETGLRLWYASQYTEYLIRGVFFLLSLRVYLKAHSFVFTILLIILIIFGKPCKNMSMGNPQRLCDFIRSQIFVWEREREILMFFVYYLEDIPVSLRVSLFLFWYFIF